MSGAARARRLDKLDERLDALKVPRSLAAMFARAARGPASKVAHDVLKVTLSTPQAAVLDDPARFKLLIAGRRFGKSYCSLVAAILDAMSGPGRVVWIVSPTYRAARDTLWPLLRRLVPARALVGTPRETDLSVQFKNGSTIALRSGDEPNLLRGSGLNLCVFDEASQLSEDLWSVVLRPALADRQGRALFATTPRGTSHWLYDLWQAAAEDPTWVRWQFPTIQGGRVSASELEQAARTLSRAEFGQEFEASFESTGGRVYGDFRLEPWPSGNLDPTAEDGEGPLLVGFDPGMRCGVVLATKSEAGDVLVFDAQVVSDSHTASVADDIRRRFPGRRIMVYPDPSGVQRRSSAGHLTDHIILRQAGLEVVAPRAAPPVVDRINVVRSTILAADGRRRLRIHPSAHALLRALDAQMYDARTQAPDKKSGHDHVLDALGYLLWSVANVFRTPARIGSFMVGHGGLVLSFSDGDCTCYGCRHGTGSCAADRP